MDMSGNGANIMKRILGNRNNLVILALIGALLLIFALPSENKEDTVSPGTEESAGSGQKEELEERLERILKDTEGVGKVKVMITQKEEESSLTGEDQEDSEVEGVVVVAEGAENPVVKEKIQDIVVALFPIEVHKIEIVKMKAD